MNLQKGLVGHWSMNDADTDSGVLRDKSPYDHQCQLNGGITTSQEGIVGEAYEFDGVDDWLQRSKTDVLKYDKHTLTFWIKNIEGHTGNWDQFFCNGGGDTTDGRSPGLWLHSSTDNTIHWKLSTEADGNAGIGSTTNTATVGEWTFWAGTYDGSTQKIYYNGEIDSTLSIDSPLIHDNGDVAIGGDHGGGSSRQLALDDVRLYNRILPQTEIQALYNQRSAQQRQI